MIPEHWCLVLNLKMCLFRHWVTTFTQSDAVLKHKHRYVKQWTVGRAPKNARMFTTQRTEARLNAQIQRVEFVISRALLLFCSGSLSGNETSFSASKPCWNSVTEMNVYRVFLVSNFMVFSFVSFKAILLVFVYSWMGFPILVWSVGWKTKILKKVTRSLRIGGLKPQHHRPFHLITTPHPHGKLCCATLQ